MGLVIQVNHPAEDNVRKKKKIHKTNLPYSVKESSSSKEFLGHNLGRNFQWGCFFCRGISWSEIGTQQAKLCFFTTSLSHGGHYIWAYQDRDPDESSSTSGRNPKICIQRWALTGSKPTLKQVESQVKVWLSCLVIMAMLTWPAWDILKQEIRFMCVYEVGGGKTKSSLMVENSLWVANNFHKCFNKYNVQHTIKRWPGGTSS